MISTSDLYLTGSGNCFLSWLFEIPFCWYDLFSVKREMNSWRNFLIAPSPLLLLSLVAVAAVDNRFEREPMAIPVFARFDEDAKEPDGGRFCGGAMPFRVLSFPM